MRGYWIRHRMLFTVIFSVVAAMIIGILFVYPYMNQCADAYNSQSIYKNTDIDFIVPEPSFEQVDTLSGQYGIDKLFPYFMTKTQVSVNGEARTTTVLLCDQMQNLDITMYNEERLIEKSNEEFDNPICVDWRFCYDLSANIGDTVSLSIAGKNLEYKIYAIYETNSLYDGGAIMLEMSDEQKSTIIESSKNSGYSGMYISASDYSSCRTYLTSEYRPMGRLKSREQFDSEEQYQIHYDAIMSSGYANEITDFRIREKDIEAEENPFMLFVGAGLAAVLTMAFNLIMRRRGCEKAYFTKHCIPKGQNVKQYYTLSFCMETLLFCVCYIGIICGKLYVSDEFIPVSAVDILLIIIPIVVVFVAFVNLLMNYSMLKVITKKIQTKQ